MNDIGLPDRTPEETSRWHLDHLLALRKRFPATPKDKGDKIAVERIETKIIEAREAVKTERSSRA